MQYRISSAKSTISSTREIADIPTIDPMLDAMSFIKSRILIASYFVAEIPVCSNTI